MCQALWSVTWGLGTRTEGVRMLIAVDFNRFLYAGIRPNLIRFVFVLYLHFSTLWDKVKKENYINFSPTSHRTSLF